MKTLKENDIVDFFRSLVHEYTVMLPVILPDGDRMLGHIDEHPAALIGGRLPGKPTSVFFPHHETFATLSRSQEYNFTKRYDKPLLVAGFTAEDLKCLDFIDMFYSTDFPDSLYFGKRDDSIVVCISGHAGPDGAMMTMAGGTCDLELVFDGRRFAVIPHSEAGHALEKRISCSVTEPFDLDALQKESDSMSKEAETDLKTASRLMHDDKVPREFWQEVADRCIVCCTCVHVCPSCTCFECYERDRGEHAERYRMWDACMLNGFTREASGHSPFYQETTRLVRRIRHRLVDDYLKWNRISCFLCGRCDDVCPTGLGIQALAHEIVQRYGKEAVDSA